ncbi:hypothetical protein L596_017578 [Steinernema carpocapsae]|uniref:Uncharacterized protein n=1 Tax=Steinernema carpocapsae TaxID=34508 RepID=A0A4U5N2T6_STECR|nr:hypothetical protein L596_017578 [Steinernema carpocapsae]
MNEYTPGERERRHGGSVNEEGKEGFKRHKGTIEGYNEQQELQKEQTLKSKIRSRKDDSLFWFSLLLIAHHQSNNNWT